MRGLERRMGRARQRSPASAILLGTWQWHALQWRPSPTPQWQQLWAPWSSSGHEPTPSPSLQEGRLSHCAQQAPSPLVTLYS